MAKSTRSKVKRSFRAKKRQSGVYAATEAARLNRLSSKLVTLATKDQNEDKAEDHDVEEEGDEKNVESSSVAMEADGAQQSSPTESQAQRISTHGPRNSRREQWRMSKGLAPISSQRGMNRQGGLAARRKAGRPSRRR